MDRIRKEYLSCNDLHALRFVSGYSDDRALVKLSYQSL